MAIGIDCDRSFVEVEGVRTAYYRRGTGPTVVLLHGGAPGACSDLHWFRNFAVLADAGFDVVAFDQPGFGHSEVPFDWALEFRYRHALEFLRSLDVESLFLVGSSIGGLLGTLLAYRLKDGRGPGVEGLLLAAPFPHFEMAEDARAKYLGHRSRLAGVEANFESVQALCRNTFYNASLATDDIVRLRLSMLRGDNWIAYRKRTEVGNAFDAGHIQSAPLDTPTLIVWGVNDKSIPPEVGFQAVDHFTDAQFLFLPRCGHWPQTEQTSAFNRAALGFLQSVMRHEGPYGERLDNNHGTQGRAIAFPSAGDPADTGREPAGRPAREGIKIAAGAAGK
jgi:2-hydroxy-6-oxonona-2,4-dienedioate hydrolase